MAVVEFAAHPQHRQREINQSHTWQGSHTAQLLGFLMPSQNRSALQWPAQSNYRLKAEDVLKFQNHDRGRRGATGFRMAWMSLAPGDDVLPAFRRQCSFARAGLMRTGFAEAHDY
jgi:hypothetical protein